MAVLAECYELIFCNQASREFMVPVFAPISDPLLQPCRQLANTTALRLGQPQGEALQFSWVIDLLSG
jgi:hypothetical protein